MDLGFSILWTGKYVLNWLITYLPTYLILLIFPIFEAPRHQLHFLCYITKTLKCSQNLDSFFICNPSFKKSNDKNFPEKTQRTEFKSYTKSIYNLHHYLVVLVPFLSGAIECHRLELHYKYLKTFRPHKLGFLFQWPAVSFRWPHGPGHHRLGIGIMCLSEKRKINFFQFHDFLFLFFYSKKWYV